MVLRSPETAICFEENEAEQNYFNGFKVTGNSNIFEENQAEENGNPDFRQPGYCIGAGFCVEGDFNSFEENEAQENFVTGFMVSGNNNIFEENEAAENGFGFAPPERSQRSQRRRRAFEEDCLGAGFCVTGNSNTFEDNEAEENAGYGFVDTTTGASGDFGTDNFYDDNECEDNLLGGSLPAGLCD